MDDWNDIEPAYIDEVNDQDPDADYDGTDLHKFYLAKDDTFLYVMMTMYDGAPKADLGWATNFVFQANQYRNIVDSEGDYETGAASSNGKWKVWTAKTGGDVIFYSSEYKNVGSNFIEWKVYLEEMGTLDGKFIRVFIHTFGGDCGECPVNEDNVTSIHIVDEDTTTTTPTPISTTIPTPTPTAMPTSKPTPTSNVTPTPAAGGMASAAL
jgi:hypothetical protein